MAWLSEICLFFVYVPVPRLVQYLGNIIDHSGTMAATSHLPVLAVVNIEPSSSSIARLLRRLKGQSNGRPTSSHTVESSSVSSSLSDPKSAEKTANIKSDVYREEGLQEFYVPIASYEGRHRYDPTAQWTEKEERSLIRRVRQEISSSPRINANDM